MGSVRGGFRLTGGGTAARVLHVVLAGLLMMAVLPGGVTSASPALAAGGDYSLDFVAAAPFIYDHSVGGGAFNDRTVGKTDDIVESLEGGDFACGDIVTYLTEIMVDDLSDGGSPATNETIELEYTLGAEATNGVSVGHIDVVNASVNYGSVVNGAGPGGTDSGMSDDLGSSAAIVFEQFTSGASPDGSYPDPQEDELVVRIRIDDLESTESVILRFDVLLGCGFGSIGVGNIQAKLSDKRVVESDGQPVDDPIPGGAQTIPFKSVSNEELIAPSITVVKSNDANGDGTFSDTETAPPGVPVTVTYQVTVTNDSPDPVEVSAVGDDTHSIAGSSCAALVGTTIASGDTVTCTFDATFTTDDQTVTNIFSTTAFNDGGEASDSDDSTVIIPDLLPAIDVTKTASPTSVPETGGDVTYSVTVANEGPEVLLLTSLVDDMFGDLNGAGTCSVPQSVAVGGSYSCEFTQFVAGDAGTSHVNVVTGTGSDDDGNEVSDADDAVVDFTDELPAIEVTKTASPVAVPESGGDVTYSVTVANEGPEVLLLTSLVDDMFGDLNGAGTCSVPQSVVVGGTYSCEFTETVAGPAGSSHDNVVTATGSDDDDNEVSDTDDASVLFTDEIPAIDVTKTASPTSVPETGGDVTYTITVENTGETDITLESIVDDVFGDLNGVGTCAVPQELLEGATYTCEFTQFVTGNAGVDHVNVVTVAGTDEGGDDVSDADDETVEFEAIIDLEVTKAVAPGTVAPGENASWTITVINQGPSNATGVELTDVAEAGLTYVSHTGDGTFDPATGLWIIGELAVGERATIELVTTVEDAGAFTNTVEVTAADQEDIDSVPGDGQGDDFAAATVLAVEVLAAGTIGDFVWRDTDADGVQDVGEKGIPGAKVVLTNLDTDVVVSMTTNEDGMYLFAALVAGNYRVSVDRSTVSGALTTPGTYTLFLAESEQSLDNDFGFAEKLPETGANLGDLTLAGALLVLFGLALVVLPRRRRSAEGTLQ